MMSLALVEDVVGSDCCWLPRGRLLPLLKLSCCCCCCRGSWGRGCLYVGAFGVAAVFGFNFVVKGWRISCFCSYML